MGVDGANMKLFKNWALGIILKTVKEQSEAKKKHQLFMNKQMYPKLYWFSNYMVFSQ